MLMGAIGEAVHGYLLVGRPELTPALADTLVDVVEPYLLQIGFLDRTPRGRVATYGQIAREAGLEPGRDIPIEYVGLRRGEKLHENLLCDSETAFETGHHKILGVRFYVEVIGEGDNLQIAVAMYSYDANGNQLWLVGNVAIADGDIGAEVIRGMKPFCRAPLPANTCELEHSIADHPARMIPAIC